MEEKDIRGNHERGKPHCEGWWGMHSNYLGEYSNNLGNNFWCMCSIGSGSNAETVKDSPEQCYGGKKVDRVCEKDGDRVLI